MVVHTPNTSGLSEYKNPMQLTKWLKIFLYAGIVLKCIGILSSFLQYQFLSELPTLAANTPQDVLTAAAEQNDLRHSLVFLFQLIVVLCTGIIFLMWIYLANQNVRALGATNLRFTPKSAITWYIIPIFNVWKPYQAMKEIWRASKNPSEWTSLPAEPLLRWWWFFWIVSSQFDFALFKLSFKVQETDINGLLSLTGLQIISDSISIALQICAILLITRIITMQIKSKK